MAIRRAGFKWYDGFFLSMLAFSIIMVGLSWKRYHLCEFPLHLWIVVDYTTVFVFRILMFVDNGLAAGMVMDYDINRREIRLCGRVLVLPILYLVLYPFLWAWSIVGCVWFATAKDCLPEKNQKWGFLVWLLFSFCGLICLAGNFVKKWITRRRERLQHDRQLSAYEVLIDMICWPEMVVATAPSSVIFNRNTNVYDSGNILSDSQRVATETRIRDLPMFRLKAIPSDCSDCPICLEEFIVGQTVRGLPCAHNFHVACIDKWLELNVKCPRCRCCVFPNLDLSTLTTIPVDPNQSTHQTVSQPLSQSYLLRMQSYLLPIRPGNTQPSSSGSTSGTGSGGDSEIALEIVENGGQPSESRDLHTSAENVQ